MEDESYGRLSVEESMAPGGLPKEEGVAHESEQDTPGDLPKEEGVAHESEQDTPGDLPKEEGVALEGLRELEVRSGLPSGAAPGCILLEENEVVTSSPCTEEVPMWMHILNLTGNDKVLLEHGGCLNDQIIFSVQKLLQNNFPNIQGWQSTHCSYANQLFKPITDGAEYVQILLTRGNHWITVSNILRHNQRRVGGTLVAIYYSLRGLYIEHKRNCDVAFFVHSKLDKLEFNIMNIDGQLNLTDCGVYAIAYATHLAHGLDPTSSLWHHNEKRSHLLSCIEDGKITCFPCDDCLICSRRTMLELIIEDVYCHCRLPNDRTKSMICCNGCSKWFHHICVQLQDNTLYGKKMEVVL